MDIKITVTMRLSPRLARGFSLFHAAQILNGVTARQAVAAFFVRYACPGRKRRGSGKQV